MITAMALIQSLVGELRSCKLSSIVKKKKIIMLRMSSELVLRFLKLTL